MLGFLLSDLLNIRYLLSSPIALVIVAFQVWMLIDAIRRDEWYWAVCIFFFWGISAALYFFLVYRQQGSVSSSTRGFELPGAHDRRRIKELEAKIHHLDKAHHYLQLADIYFQQGKLEKAETNYRASLERDAEDIDTRAHLGQCLLRQKRAPEAKGLLEGVCRQDPKHDYGYSLMALAETYMALGEMDAAVACWERVLENHAYARAKVQLAELYLQRNDKNRACVLVEETVADDVHAPAFQRKRERFWVRRAKRLRSRIV